MGTPAYMSPEQHRAQSVDPRSDQFSFCVVVYEAMYGQRPFSGRTRQAIALQAIRGKVRAPPPDVVVPEHVRRAVMRGLSTDPGRRWPDMKALLEALDRDPADRKRWGLRAAVAMAGLAGTVTALTFWPGDSAPTPVCEVTYDRVADTIVRHEPARNEPNPERKTEIERRLERWSTRWLEVRVEACRASRVTRTQSQALSGAQYECLDQRHRELEAALTRLDEVSEEQRSGTIAVLGSLSSPDRCADKALAQDEADLLALLDAGDRDRLAALVAIEAIARIVPLEEALAQVDGAAEGARDPRVSTRARWLEGELRRRTGDLSGAESLLHEAARRGAGADDQELLVRAWTSLTALAADRGDRSADGERWARYATAALSRHGPDPRLAARLLTQTGRALAAAGRTREAAAHLISATEAWQRLPDADPFGTAETQLALAELALADARPRAAVETGRRALDLLGSAVGPDHPARAPAELLVGRCELALDRPEQARTLLEHARRIARSPGDRFDIAIELARLALREDERDGAAELLRAALRAPDHPTQGQALARAQFLLGKALAGDRAPTGEARELGLSALESLDLQSPGQARLADAIDDWLGEHTEPSRPAGDEAPP